jgi:hypothetical protein
MRITKSALRKDIIRSLADQGFEIEGTNMSHPEELSKHQIRSLHLSDKTQRLEREAAFVRDQFSTLSCYFADGNDINPRKFLPILRPVEPNSEHAALFRFATLLWSVPVSRGFGRRTRFLVFDEHNGKLIGLFALGDPVFNLRARDQFIGWDHCTRADRLYHVMDIFVLGAVPPMLDCSGASSLRC